MASKTTVVVLREVPLSIEVTVTAGSPATGPTYDCGGHPGDPPEAEVKCIKVADRNIELSWEQLQMLVGKKGIESIEEEAIEVAADMGDDRGEPW